MGGKSEILKERVTDLEVKVAFQEETIRQLDAELRVQGDRIELLLKELVDLREQYSQLEHSETPKEEEVPPHYGSGSYT